MDEVRPYLDRKALDGARRVRLPADPDRPADEVPGDELAPLAAGLVRVALNRRLAEKVT